MYINFSKNKNVLTIYFYGELDERLCRIIKDDLDAIVNDNLNVSKVIFDLSGLSFMDSTGIGLLIGRYKKFKSVKIDCFISGANTNIEKIIYLSGLYKIMPKY